MNVEDLLGYKLKKTQHALRIAMDETLKIINLTTPQYAVLAQLELQSGISNAELEKIIYYGANNAWYCVEFRKTISHKKRKIFYPW